MLVLLGIAWGTSMEAIADEITPLPEEQYPVLAWRYAWDSPPTTVVCLESSKSAGGRVEIELNNYTHIDNINLRDHFSEYITNNYLIIPWGFTVPGLDGWPHVTKSDGVYTSYWHFVCYSFPDASDPTGFGWDDFSGEIRNWKDCRGHWFD